jgi:hypothetical protein
MSDEMNRRELPTKMKITIQSKQTAVEVPGQGQTRVQIFTSVLVCNEGLTMQFSRGAFFNALQFTQQDAGVTFMTSNICDRLVLRVLTKDTGQAVAEARIPMHTFIR